MKHLLKKNRKGFTLLEIIIVVIIIGVLASLALPRLLNTVERSRSAEAFASLGSVRSAMERCYLPYGTFANCGTFTNLDVGNPANSANSHFTYSFTGVSATGYTIRATRNTRDAGNTNDWVQILQDDSTNTVTRSGNTAFGGV